ncbi:MAG: gluconate 2-dehydrogenase alpha chain [Solirubrobacterales bacterium]|jgi:gluconate 2-dehydrogenase alpha chain|nr:gluconate 2-dehydrogenase alpha chain [Solirubrobacterales bacterium]
MSKRFDAVVVGMGASGAIVAEQLSKAGLEVVGLEKGPDYTADDFEVKHDELRYYQRNAIVAALSNDPVTWRPNESTEARIAPWSAGPLGVDEPLYGLPSIGTGGGSLHWGGAAFRFREADFSMRTTIEGRFGAGALPPDTTLVDWPIGYRDLEPYYEMAEYEQGISGRAGNLDGEIRAGGNPFEAPRSREFPMPPLRQGAADHPFVEACERLGYHPYPTPTGINSVPYGGRPACVYCGFCHGFPCHVGAKSSTQVTSVPEAKATGRFELRPFSRAFKVNLDARGRARGVSYFSSDGEVREIEAERVILACYALENTRLLLHSGIDQNGQVGRHFMTHNYGWFTSVLPEPTNPFMGPLTAASVIDDLTSELVPDNDEGVLWGSPILSVTGDLQPIEAFHSMPPAGPRWGAGLKEWLRDRYRYLHKMYSQTATLPRLPHYCDLDPKVVDPFGVPVLRITHDWDEIDVRTVRFLGRFKQRIAEEMGATEAWEDPARPPYHMSTHDVGLHRMGENPATSVTDVKGEVHGCPGLYAIGGGQFPSYGAYNPTLTIQALAYLTAERMLSEAGVGQGQAV